MIEKMQVGETRFYIYAFTENRNKKNHFIVKADLMTIEQARLTLVEAKKAEPAAYIMEGRRCK